MGCAGSTAAPVEASPNDKGQAQSNSALQKKHTADHYQIVKTLGMGASCKVVVAKHKTNKNKYALKILNKGADAANADNEYLFMNEFKILRELRHKNIVEFVEAYEDDNTYNLVTVMCTGGELFDRVSEGSFSEKVASRLARSMLLAINHCHERDITHRDLKPENFVFETPDENSDMKLIDFGCAVKSNDDALVEDVAGSPYYVAPEVLHPTFRRTGKVWKAADMWSIGVIIFLLVHGFPPFNGESQKQIFAKIKEGRYKISREIPLSKEVKDLIKKLLVMKPDERLNASQALRHPWISDQAVAPDTPIPPKVVKSLGAFRAQCRLKKAVGRVLAKQMTDADKETLAQVFRQFDANGDGRLSGDEIAEMMKSIGRPESDAKELMEQFDDNNDGTLDQAEFNTMHQAGLVADEKAAKEAFSKFDIDGDGVVTVAEIEKMCQLSPDEAKKMIAEVDRNGDGKVDFAEWVAAMTARRT